MSRANDVLNMLDAPVCGVFSAQPEFFNAKRIAGEIRLVIKVEGGIVYGRIVLKSSGRFCLGSNAKRLSHAGFEIRAMRAGVAREANLLAYVANRIVQVKIAYGRLGSFFCRGAVKAEQGN